MVRDSGPVFVVTENGDKPRLISISTTGKEAALRTRCMGASVIAGFASAGPIQTKLVLEGGGIEVDGHGTAIITVSRVLNENRNREMS